MGVLLSGRFEPINAQNVWQKMYAADLVRYAVTSGDDSLAREVVAVVEALVPGGSDHVAAAVAKHCRALTERNGADLLEAAEPVPIHRSQALSR